MTTIYSLLRGGDRRSIADSNRVRALVEADPSLVAELDGTAHVPGLRATLGQLEE